MMEANAVIEELGLRERKKQRTRQLIAETAMSLFAQRGFDRVTVAEIARVAEVAEKTVFNYFSTKEDLVYWRMESFVDHLLQAIREREPRESVLEAFGRFVLTPRGLLTKQDPEARERLIAINKVIAESPALLAHEQQVFARFAASLAAVIAEETGAADDDITPRVAADAMMGIHRALVDYTRHGVLSGRPFPRLIREVRAQGERAITQLERGLGRYATKRR
jgi:AcrR family transcriptional regulator